MVGFSGCTVDSRHDGQAGVEQPGRGRALEGQSELGELDDRVEVAAKGQVVADFAVARYGNRGVQPHGKRGDVSQGDRGRLATF